VPVVVGKLTAPLFSAQSSGQEPAGQSPEVAGDRPSFDVASVKANKAGENRTLMLVQPGGTFQATNVTMQMLINGAYQLKPRQLVGSPDWIGSEHFDIEAKAEGNPPKDQINLMLQSLLADRFKLVVHRETRQLPIYTLMLSRADRTGPELLAHTDDTKCADFSNGSPPQGSGAGAPRIPCGGFTVGVGRIGSITAIKATMEQLARTLSNSTDRTVVDRTGLSGTFDLTLNFTPEVRQPGFQLGADAIASDPTAPPDIFTAIQEQLGLKLVPQTGPVDVLVIDHVEEPSPN
jgi:uncharacterized protein (TIGR03435 family)